MATKKILCVNLYDFASTFQTIIGRRLTRLEVSLYNGLFFLKKGVTSPFFTLQGSSPVVSTWLKSCCNALAVVTSY